MGIIGKVVLRVATFKPQLVYVTPTACGGGFYKDFVVVQLLKLMRRKVVVHYHNKGVVTRQDKKLDDWMYRRFFKGIKVILLSDALYEDVKKYVKREQVLICEMVFLVTQLMQRISLEKIRRLESSSYQTY